MINKELDEHKINDLLYKINAIDAIKALKKATGKSISKTI